MNSFRDFKVIKNAVSKDVLDFVRVEFDTIINGTLTLSNLTVEENIIEKDTVSDDQVPHSFPMYGPLFGETLLQILKPTMEREINKELHPCYSYARKYFKGAKMKKHTDRPSCQYSATLCIAVNKELWPIFFETNGEEHKVLLEPGDMIVYDGCNIPHWRKKYKPKDPDSYVMQVFLHYVDANGEYKDHIYDKRPCLGVVPEDLSYRHLN